ncbi:MAG: succinate--CoA ligase subunit alpha [Candidatus Glassbacteria bacterium RBG_16_58_8]|uniref:Succinate--CoA ligase [ADP-forming] subunit alpha n=1 Tax=Candidatus Glassbacteria bacterium RBG_16_58_8 TaxID=1817866 RepID=A0A1F5YBL3_9BACT|nr:MAG: succinate--CoA ligase subunit alpha [Candidatus Glassbacteria bacterium RBG_16_58_8]
MSIFVNDRTRLLVQGITGRDGSFHTRQMVAYGTRVVAGVTPSKGGSEFEGIPIYDTVVEAVESSGANTSIIYVPPAFAADAIYEAVSAGIELLVCITEGIPVLDMTKIYRFVKENGSRLIGPNCPGVISPGKAKVGILPGHIFRPGSVGVVSRSGTLTYEIVFQLTSAGLGQSTWVGIGGDAIIGTDFIDCLERFEADEETRAVVLIGEIGGNDEQRAAEFIEKSMEKPVVAFVTGQTAPPGRRMGHAGAIIQGSGGTAREKIEAFEKAGVQVAQVPAEISRLLAMQL